MKKILSTLFFLISSSLVLGQINDTVYVSLNFEDVNKHNFKKINRTSDGFNILFEEKELFKYSSLNRMEYIGNEEIKKMKIYSLENLVEIYEKKRKQLIDESVEKKLDYVEVLLKDKAFKKMYFLEKQGGKIVKYPVTWIHAIFD